MKLPSTLITAMLITATIGMSTGCKSSKSHHGKGYHQPHGPGNGAAGNCPACGRG